MSRRLRKGQSTAEYAIVIGLVLAAAIGMQVYVKRGIQGKVRDASDDNITYVFNGTGNLINNTIDYGVNDIDQYEPRYSTSTEMISTRDSDQTTTVSVGGGVKREINGNETSSRTGKQETLVSPQK